MKCKTTPSLFLWIIGMFSLLTITFTTSGCEDVTKETIVLEHYRTSCVGEGPRGCYITDHGFFYDEIKGFEYQWGHTYTLEMNVYKKIDTVADQLVADQSDTTYELSRILSDESVSSDRTFSIPMFSTDLIGWSDTADYTLFWEREIDCETNNLCSEVENAIEQEKLCATYEFQHGNRADAPLILVSISDYDGTNDCW